MPVSNWPIFSLVPSNHPRSLKWQMNKWKDKIPGLTTVSSLLFYLNFDGQIKKLLRKMFFQSVTQAAGTVFFLSVEATNNHTITYHTKWSTINMLYKLHFWIIFQDKLSFSCHTKGKVSHQRPPGSARAQLCWMILYLPISSYMLTPWWAARASTNGLTSNKQNSNWKFVSNVLSSNIHWRKFSMHKSST